MRVKVGQTWHEVTPDQPIAVELSMRERELIRDMPATATRIAFFHDRCNAPVDAKRAWIAE